MEEYAEKVFEEWLKEQVRICGRAMNPAYILKEYRNIKKMNKEAKRIVKNMPEKVKAKLLRKRTSASFVVNTKP